MDQWLQGRTINLLSQVAHMDVHEVVDVVVVPPQALPEARASEDFSRLAHEHFENCILLRSEIYGRAGAGHDVTDRVER